MRETTRDFYDPVYGYDYETTGYALEAVPLPADREAAYRLVERHCLPPSREQLSQELARLRASTKARAEADGDLAMTFQVLAEECEGYPADIVAHTLRAWARRETFFPSLAEIRADLQRNSKRRLALLECLRRNE